MQNVQIDSALPAIGSVNVHTGEVCVTAHATMDEVENPDLPAAGESSPTLRATEDEQTASDVGAAGKAAQESASAVTGYSPDETSNPVLPAPRTALPARPLLSRETSVPPPQQPPSALPSSSTEQADYSRDPPDSLTLADLKRIRSSFPTAPHPQRQQILEFDQVYDFDYRDAQSFPCELDEWFSYSEEEENKLKKCKAIFEQEWRATEDGKKDWLDVTEDSRRAFTKKWIQVLQDPSQERDVTDALMILTYIGLGVWDETAGRQEGCALEDLFPNSTFGGSRLDEYSSSSLQVQWIVAMVDTLHSCDGLNKIFDTLRRVCEDDFANIVNEISARNDPQPRRADETTELWCCLTLMYLFIEIARTTANAQALKRDILALDPNFLNYLTQIVAKLRWDEYAPIPLPKMMLLCWKTILVTFGGIKDVENMKRAINGDREEEKDMHGKPVITASPLDYHLFRQEISSKYPAYQPPPPLFPLEPESNSILPPLKHRRPSSVHSETAFPGAPGVGTGSIMHQPVHIATPAPSPPPSPGGPGKAGKKQNYQTNQMFPFLYPPLDASSNDLGGKGSTERQDALVGRKWKGSDIPTSISEAAELFSKRMRATRAMKQLWEVRGDFMKQERGWKDFDGLDTADETQGPQASASAKGDDKLPPEAQEVLSKVDAYYRDSLPHLQSVVIVLLKSLLQNVTDLVTRSGQNGLQAGIQFNDPNGMNGHRTVENGINPYPLDNVESSAEEVDRMRCQEISGKALSGIVLLLLKWFKLSHVLQYEYLTQLLTDSNYVPMVIKFWQVHDIGRACHFKLDREDRSFFYFCQKTSRQGAPKITQVEPAAQEAEESEDEAAPPPIKLKRDEPAEINLNATSDDLTHPPEVDELGYPTTALPSKPIKTYSYRNMFTMINYLRILQKVTRRKTHRALLLVSYKSSQFFRKSLKVPVHLLRYYTLKLYKAQVPFCGRKWRQNNMKVITAVWLSIPADLRDDWLSGGGGGMGGAFVGDVDGTVEDAVPLEQSLRTLTHWWNVRTYPNVMGVDKGLLNEEMNYFTRELEKLELTRDEEYEEEQSLANGPWDGQMEVY